MGEIRRRDGLALGQLLALDFVFVDELGVSLEDVEGLHQGPLIAVGLEDFVVVLLFFLVRHGVALPPLLVHFQLHVNHCAGAGGALELQVAQQILKELVHSPLFVHFQANRALVDFLGLQSLVFKVFLFAEVFETGNAGASLAVDALEHVVAEHEADGALVVLGDLLELGLLVKVIAG